MLAQLEFDDQVVVRAVTRLAAAHRTAFAAACAERLLPSYEAFTRAEGVGAPQLLREGLDVAWAFARSGATAGRGAHHLTQSLLAGASDGRVRDLCEAIERETPDASGPSMELRALAIGAAACVVFALRSGHVGNAESAILAAMTARETVLLAALGDEGFLEDDEHHAAIVEARAMREVVQQGRDLDLLAGARTVTPDTIDALKASAMRVYASAPRSSMIVSVNLQAASPTEVDDVRAS